MSHPFELSADALRALRKLRPNEITQMRRAFDVIKNDPQHGDTNCELLSQNNKHLLYRYRSPVGFVFYLIHKNKEDAVVVTSIVTFRKKSDALTT